MYLINIKFKILAFTGNFSQRKYDYVTRNQFVTYGKSLYFTVSNTVRINRKNICILLLGTN